MFAGMFRTEIQDKNTFLPTNDWFIAAPNQEVIDAGAPPEEEHPEDDDDFWDCGGAEFDSD